MSKSSFDKFQALDKLMDSISQLFSEGLTEGLKSERSRLLLASTPEI